jgi:hypothetical protein
MFRLDPMGRDIGDAYQQQCIESWRRSGFDPVSVNSANEPYNHSVRMVPASRDASRITGRPHVFLSDLLAVASAEASGRPFAVMNADLLIPRRAALATKVSDLPAGEFLFSRRVDIDQPTEIRGQPWYDGYDFFAGHADDISCLPDAGMVFGAPWWDHLLPLLMFTQGCRIYQFEPSVRHLKHDEQWSWAVWEKLGNRFITEVHTHVRDERYRSRLGDAITGRSGRLLPDLKYLLWKRLPKNIGEEPRRILNRVSEASVSFLDEIALDEPAVERTAR